MLYNDTQTFKLITETNLFGDLHNLLVGYCSATHVSLRQCVSHDPLVVSHTSKSNQYCLTTNNTDWDIHLQVKRNPCHVKSDTSLFQFVNWEAYIKTHGR